MEQTRLTAMISSTHTFVHSIATYNGNRPEFVYLNKPYDFNDERLKETVGRGGQWVFHANAALFFKIGRLV